MSRLLLYIGILQQLVAQLVDVGKGRMRGVGESGDLQREGMDDPAGNSIRLGVDGDGFEQLQCASNLRAFFISQKDT